MNFHGIARRSPGFAQAARRQIFRAAAFAASRFLFVLLFFDLLRGEGFPPSLRIAAIASGRPDGALCFCPLVRRRIGRVGDRPGGYEKAEVSGGVQHKVRD